MHEQQTGLWIEETHYDSRQVWKHGVRRLDDQRLHLEPELVFDDKAGFRYLHRLTLAPDQMSLIGSVRRSDQGVESSSVLMRRSH